MKSKITTIIAFLIVLSIGLTSCSNQYKLTLVKNENATNDVAKSKISHPLKTMEPKKINLVKDSNDGELVTSKISDPNPITTNQINDLAVNSSSVNNESGIDKNLYSNESKWKSYYPEFTATTNKQSSPGYHESDHGDLILYVILAILIPPLAVYLYQGDITTDFWIDLILTLCFDLPGIIFALYIILR